MVKIGRVLSIPVILIVIVISLFFIEPYNLDGELSVHSTGLRDHSTLGGLRLDPRDGSLIADKNKEDVIKLLMSNKNDLESNYFFGMEKEYKQLKSLFQDLKNPNLADSNGMSLLMYAVFFQDRMFIDELISLGVDLNALDIDGANPLLISALIDDYNIAEILLSNGALVNYEGLSSPLIMSVKHDNSEMVELFINNGMELESIDENSNTSLLNAFRYSDIKVVKALLEGGAKETAVNLKEENINILAAKSGDIDKLKLALSINGDAFYESSNGVTLLMAASQKGGKESIEFLIDRGLDVNVASDNGQTALFNAAVGLNLDGINALIDNGADINSKIKPESINSNTLSLFMLARKELGMGDTEESAELELLVSKKLIESGADPFQRDINGKAALHYAVELNKYEVVNELISYDKRLKNIFDNSGMTPLDYAIYQGNEEMIDILR